MVVATTAGQACVAATRMLVPRERKDEVLDAVSAAYGAVVVGAPTDPAAMMGPVISAAQRERCERFVTLAEEHGGKVAVGGGRPAQLDRGYYFEPTVLDLPDNANPAAQEEIFGPCSAVLGVRRPRRRGAHRERQRVRAVGAGLRRRRRGRDRRSPAASAPGAVNVNTGMFSAYAPSGGYKQSGLGRERGPDGIRAFQEVKHLAIGELSP